METNTVHSYEMEINHLPQKVRWRVTNKETISQVSDVTRASVTTRGTHIPPGKPSKFGERKLYLYIEGESMIVLEQAKTELRRLITEALAAFSDDRGGAGVTHSRYTVV